jgi:hypothetical protein
MLRKVLFGLVLIVLAACAPIRYTEVDVGFGPEVWYSYCTWNYPCFYPNNLVFVWGWGWIPIERYYWYRSHPIYIQTLPREWIVPRRRPIRR